MSVENMGHLYKKPDEHVALIEDFSDLKPEVKGILEELVRLDLSREEFIRIIHDFNSKIEEPLDKKIVRKELRLDNGRIIQVCSDEQGRVGLNYYLEENIK